MPETTTLEANNICVCHITREMITEPHLLNEIGTDSLSFALERSCRAILRGRFESQREWMEFARQMWDWELKATESIF